MKQLKPLPILILILCLSVMSAPAQEVASVNGMAGTTSIGHLVPDSKNAKKIVINWGGAGVSYGWLFGQHLFELRYFPDQIGQVEDFYYQDEKSVTKINGISRVDVYGLYYTPFFGPGFLIGLGFEQWEFRFVSHRTLGSGTQSLEIQRDEIVVHASIVDFGYQIGGGENPAFLTLKVRASNHSELVISGILGYVFD